uniref:Microcephalin 1 n=1 Tax=Oryzias melastigma TaxID=30732 RepID=A0A3B3B7R3_ORYME
MTACNNSTVLKDVVAYVDVWSSDKRANYSRSFFPQLQEMGAQVAQRFSKQVTHVVFNCGHPATWRKAKKSDVHLVSALWINRCFDEGTRVDEGLFPASNDESNPVIKNRRHRCMLPKNSPERKTENDWRKKKKLNKMLKDLPSKEPQVADLSPIIIDQENGIIYSPSMKRADYMAQRLKDMKDKLEDLSLTASQTGESCSPTGIKPALGMSPSVLKFKLDDDPHDDSCVSVSSPGCLSDEEGISHSETKDFGHSISPLSSPCQDVPKRISRLRNFPRFDLDMDEEGNKSVDPEIDKDANENKTKTTEKAQSKLVSESPPQDRSDDSKGSDGVQKLPPIKSTRLPPNKFEVGNKKQLVKSCTKASSNIYSGAVKSSRRHSASVLSLDSKPKMSKETSVVKKTDKKTPKQSRSLVCSLIKPFTLSSECESVTSGPTDGDSDVFEDYFSPANHRKSVFPDLPQDLNIQIPFELSPLPIKRKQRSENHSSDTKGKKKRKLEENSCGKHLEQQSNESYESWPFRASDSPQMTKKQSTRKDEDDATDNQKPATSTGQPSLQAKDLTGEEQPKKSDFPVLYSNPESGGDECTGAAGFKEIPPEAEENLNKQDGSSLQTMVNKAKVMRTLVMTSMPTEKQSTVVQVVKTLGGFLIVDQVCESTTHVVSGGHRRTLNILLGIARGCWILSFEWILWCLEQRQWIPEEPYELSDQFPAAQICRLQRHLSAGEHQQDLFQDQPAMFVSQHSQPPPQSLVELIQLCGGAVCKTVRQAGICIGKYSGRRPEGNRILSEQWILGKGDSCSSL